MSERFGKQKGDVKMKYDLLRICEDGICKDYIKMNGIEKPLDEILEQSIKKQGNYKKAILDFLKFMGMDNSLMEIMVDEFLEEVYDGD